MLPVVLKGCETWSLTLKKKGRWRVGNRKMSILGHKIKEVTGAWRKLHEELNYL
jgi:hypothetical protein